MIPAHSALATAACARRIVDENPAPIDLAIEDYLAVAESCEVEAARFHFAEAIGPRSV
jgi:hypothetical protein